MGDSGSFAFLNGRGSRRVSHAPRIRDGGRNGGEKGSGDFELNAGER
jgi:hypothetical protein